MIGLTWGDPALTLTWPQWAAVVGNCAAWCARPKRSTAWLTVPLLACAFWGSPIGRDAALLFEQAAELRGLPWGAFLARFWREPYLEYQTPFFPFVVSRLPVFWAHQVVLLPAMVLGIRALFRVYGSRAALICATPLFAVLSTQPSTDMYLFLVLVAALLAVQQRRMLTAALLYGAAWLVKPLVLITLPIMALRLGAWIGVSLLCWGGYILRSLPYEFGRHQLDFLLHAMFLKQLGAQHPRIVFQPGAVAWRWRHISLPGLWALPVWTFPAWTSGLSLMTIVVTIGIVLGYGNLKYFLLMFPFVFHLRTTKDDGIFQTLS